MTGCGGVWSPRLCWKQEIRGFKSHLPDLKMEIEDE